MGASLTQAWLHKNLISNSQCTICDLDPMKLQPFKNQGLSTTSQANLAITKDSLILLAVKPQILPALLADLKPLVNPKQLWLSIAAGIQITTIKKWLQHPKAAVIRVMPNTPALAMTAFCGWSSSQEVTPQDQAFVKKLLMAIGKEKFFTDEKKLHAVTAISGSGPAYFFALVEALEQAAIDLGLPDSTAKKMAIQTMVGAAALIKQTNKPAQELRKQVTSPGGTTEAALLTLSQQDWAKILIAATKKAYERSQELGNTPN